MYVKMKRLYEIVFISQRDFYIYSVRDYSSLLRSKICFNKQIMMQEYDSYCKRFLHAHFECL